MGQLYNRSTSVKITDMQEIYKPVIGYEWLYEVSNYGRIRTLTARGRWKAGRECSQNPNGKGYLTVHLTLSPDFDEHKTVHQIVAETFIGKPFPSAEVNHLDGNKANNRLDNLEYTTRKGNITHAYKLGLRDSKGSKNGRAKLTEADVVTVKRLLVFNTVSQVAKVTGFSKSAIADINCGRTWQHVMLG